MVRTCVCGLASFDKVVAKCLINGNDVLFRRGVLLSPPMGEGHYGEGL